MVDNLLHSFQLCKVPYATDVSANPHYWPTKETEVSWNTEFFRSILLAFICL